MNATYSRLKDIIANPQSVDMDEETPLPPAMMRVNPAPPDTTVIPGWGIAARMLRELTEDPRCAVEFTANLGEADSRRRGMNTLLRRVGDNRVVSVERMDPRAPGGVNRTSPWIARIHPAMVGGAA